MNRFPPLIGVVLCVVAWGTLPTAAQTRACVLGSGGAPSFQDGTRLCITLGQAAIGGITGSGLIASQGFWHPPAAKSGSGTDDRSGESASLKLIASPNPFSGSTELRFSIPEAGRVSLELYNALGQRVRTLIEKDYDAGTAATSVDLSELASGSYTVVLGIGEERVSTALVLID